ncbi:hypothetical protein GCM10028895_40140 [Pontibacter rugosus]
MCITASAQGPVQSKVDGIIAKVNSNVVLRSDLEFGYLQYLAQSKQQPNEDLKCQIFTSLLQDKLLLARAQVDSVTVEDGMVNSELNQRIDYLASQVGGTDRLEQYYNKSLKQLRDELRKTVREQMVMEKMQREITSKVTVTPKEIKKYFNAIPKDSLPYFSTEVEIGQIVSYAEIGREQKQEARQKLEDLRKRILAVKILQLWLSSFLRIRVLPRQVENLASSRKRAGARV